MNRNIFNNAIGVLTLIVAFSIVPQQSDAQLLGALAKGAKALKGANAKKKFEPLKEKADTALQKGDIAYLMSEECMTELPEQGGKMTGSALTEWQTLDTKIKTFLYTELHTIDKANYCENVETLLGKASSASDTQMKALYVDAAIGVLKAMMAYNYDVQSNRDNVVAACNNVKAAWNELPASYKPYSVPSGADIRDPRYLHNLKGGVPDADDIVAYQEKQRVAKAEVEAKKAQAAAADLEKRKAMFERGSSSCAFYVRVQKPGTANIEQQYIANIESGSTNFNIREKNGTTSIGKFVKAQDEYRVYKNNSMVGYISNECKFYDYTRSYLGELTSDGNAYDKNGYKIGEVSSGSVSYKSSYYWSSSSSISSKLFPAALFIFFNDEFASYINVKDYYH